MGGRGRTEGEERIGKVNQCNEAKVAGDWVMRCKEGRISFE